MFSGSEQGQQNMRSLGRVNSTWWMWNCPFSFVSSMGFNNQSYHDVAPFPFHEALSTPICNPHPLAAPPLQEARKDTKDSQGHLHAFNFYYTNRPILELYSPQVDTNIFRSTLQTELAIDCLASFSGIGHGLRLIGKRTILDPMGPVGPLGPRGPRGPRERFPGNSWFFHVLSI